MPLLEAHAITKRFGGLVAVNQVDLLVEPGEVHGLIGPNGAGKSTMINLLTGVYRPDTGAIQFDGHPVAGRKPHQINRLGLARTFQTIRLFGNLTVLENVIAAQIARSRSSLLSVILGLPASLRESDQAADFARELLDLVGLSDKADLLAKNLPYGQQRLLEIARALATRPKMLLLDEPAAGLVDSETEDLTTRIRHIRTKGVALLVIEHHMDMVMKLCDRVTVLDFGRRIATGTPAEIRSNPDVIDAYLGRDEEESYAGTTAH